MKRRRLATVHGDVCVWVQNGRSLSSNGSVRVNVLFEHLQLQKA